MGDLYSNLFIDVKTLEQIKKNATVVIDTNVLLMGYQWKNITFESVLKVLKQLSYEDRLKIPAHVIKEFAQNRPSKITEMSRQIHTVMSNLEKGSSVGKPLKEVIPALSIVEREHSDIIILEEKYNECIRNLNIARKEYIDGLKQLKQTLNNYFDHDLILSSYREIIEKSYFTPQGLMDEIKLKEEWKRRTDNNIPPGYMDKNKKENQYGDLIVWDYICQIFNDVIFVTADIKGDWVYTANDNAMGARRELVEEFYSREQGIGHTFKILTPLQFITLFSNEDVEQEIKEDLNSEGSKDIKDAFKKMAGVNLGSINRKSIEVPGAAYGLSIVNQDRIHKLREKVDQIEPLFIMDLNYIEEQLNEILNVFSYGVYVDLSEEYIEFLEGIALNNYNFIHELAKKERLSTKIVNIVERLMSKSRSKVGE